MMPNAASKYLFLFFLTLLYSCSSRTLVGFSYHASGNTTTSSPSRTIAFLKQNKIIPSQIRVFVEEPRILRTLSNTSLVVDLYLNGSQVENILSSKSSSISWLKTYLMPFLSQVNIKSITISGNDYARKYSLSMLLSTLKSMHSVLTSLPVHRRIKVSVAFSLSFLENSRRGHERDLHRICNCINEVGFSVIVEANIDGELSMGDRFVQLMIERARLANSILPCNDAPMVLTIKSAAVPSVTEVAEFADKVSVALGKNTQITNRIVGLYAEVDSMEDFAEKELKREEEQIFPSSRRELLSNFHLKTTSHDTFDSPTVFPTNPISTPPLPTTSPPYNPSPAIVTVPSTNPVTITPVNPAYPVAVPSTTPITIPPTNPVSSPLPLTNPAATPVTVPSAPLINNPVTTYPPPSGGVPVTTPVTNPVSPPATTNNAPAVPGQSWCLAKSGASQTALQAALDYACGMGGADCSQIQQGGSCYNPNTLQNHASFAFNSYYQKNPVSTSCDFGGVATTVNANPSTGSCIYLSSSPSSTPTSTTPNPASTPTPTTPIPTPPTPISTPPPPTTPTSTPPPITPISTLPTPISTPPPTTPISTPTPTPTSTTPPTTVTSFPPPGEGVSGSGTPPSVMNSSNPASGIMPEFGPDSPPGFNTTTSASVSLRRPSIGCLFLVTTLVTRTIVLNM